MGNYVRNGKLKKVKISLTLKITLSSFSVSVGRRCSERGREDVEASSTLGLTWWGLDVDKLCKKMLKTEKSGSAKRSPRCCHSLSEDVLRES